MTLAFSIIPGYNRVEPLNYTLRSGLSALGGPSFTILDRLLGPVAAGLILRRLRGYPYSHSRTLTEEQLALLLNGAEND